MLAHHVIVTQVKKENIENSEQNLDKSQSLVETSDDESKIQKSAKSQFEIN